MWDGSIRILEELLTSILSDRTWMYTDIFATPPDRAVCLHNSGLSLHGAFTALEVSRVLTGAGSSEKTPLLLVWQTPAHIMWTIWIVTHSARDSFLDR